MQWPVEVVEEWCLDNLGEPKRGKGRNGPELRYNDFIHGQDRQRKLYVNIGDRSGSWNAWKSGLSGDFVKLVAEFHNISEGRAFTLLVDKYTHRIGTFNRDKNPEPEEKPVLEKKYHEILPYDSFSLANDNQFTKRYRAYLFSRGMTKEFTAKCYYSLADEYRDRKIDLRNFVIMPYYDKFDKIVYWTARNLDPKSTLRYFNQPDADAGHFVYGLYNVKGDTAVCTEAILKAEKLPNLGIGTGGKSITDEQLTLIAGQNFKRIIMLPDNEPWQIGKIKGSPQKAVESAKKLLDANQDVSIFNWPEFCKTHRLKKGSIKDIDEFKGKWKLDISDIENFLMDSLFTAEITYKLNESI